MKTSFTKLFTMVAAAVILAGGLFTASANAQYGQYSQGYGYQYSGGRTYSSGYGCNSGYQTPVYKAPVYQTPVYQTPVYKAQYQQGCYSPYHKGGYNGGQINGQGGINGQISQINGQNGLNGLNGQNGSVINLNGQGNGSNGQISNGQINNGQNGSSGVITIGGQGNQGQVISLNRTTSSLPVAMQGTWFEVTTDGSGSTVLNRYELKADGSYEMFEFAVSAQGQVDLTRPTAQLSQIASAAQRSVKFENGVLTLGAGQAFAEGPYTAVVNGTTLTLTSSTESRTWTRNP